MSMPSQKYRPKKRTLSTFMHKGPFVGGFGMARRCPCNHRHSMAFSHAISAIDTLRNSRVERF